MTTTDDYETTDLNQAAFLLTRGHALLAVRGSPGERRTFVFPHESRVEALTFYQGATVPARAYTSALNDLKTLLRQR